MTASTPMMVVGNGRFFIPAHLTISGGDRGFVLVLMRISLRELGTVPSSLVLVNLTEPRMDKDSSNVPHFSLCSINLLPAK